MNNNLPTYMQSSIDPSQVSSRIKGGVIAASSIIILVATQFFHVQLNSNDVITYATELGTVGGAIWTLYGAFLWVMTKFGKKLPVPAQDATPVVPVIPTAQQ